MIETEQSYRVRGKANLFNELNASSQVHAEIDKLPRDTFSGIFFLFQHEHVMVEELLQLLVSKVNAKLLEAVILCVEESELKREKVN